MNIYIYEYIYIYIYIYVCVCVCVCEEVKQEISGTVIGTKFTPAFASIFIDKRETNFLDKILLWFRYIDDVFFIWTQWTHGKEKLEEFLKRFQ